MLCGWRMASPSRIPCLHSDAADSTLPQQWCCGGVGSASTLRCCMHAYAVDITPLYTPMLHACIRCRYHSPLPLHAPLSPARPLFPLPSRPPIQTPSLCTLPHKLIVHIDIYDPLSSPSAHYTHRLFIPFPCLGTPPPSPSPLSPPWAWPSVATHHGHVSGAVTRYSHGSAAHVTTPLGSVL